MQNLQCLFLHFFFALYNMPMFNILFHGSAKADDMCANCQSKEEMKEKALELLQTKDTVYKSVTPFKMDDTVKKMMELFCS